jgi:hypothetical protein
MKALMIGASRGGGCGRLVAGIEEAGSEFKRGSGKGRLSLRGFSLKKAFHRRLRFSLENAIRREGMQVLIISSLCCRGLGGRNFRPKLRIARWRGVKII